MRAFVFESAWISPDVDNTIMGWELVLVAKRDSELVLKYSGKLGWQRRPGDDGTPTS
jgi:hypothetical protein